MNVRQVPVVAKPTPVCMVYYWAPIGADPTSYAAYGDLHTWMRAVAPDMATTMETWVAMQEPTLVYVDVDLMGLSTYWGDVVDTTAVSAWLRNNFTDQFYLIVGP